MLCVACQIFPKPVSFLAVILQHRSKCWPYGGTFGQDQFVTATIPPKNEAVGLRKARRSRRCYLFWIRPGSAETSVGKSIDICTPLPDIILGVDHKYKISSRLHVSQTLKNNCHSPKVLLISRYLTGQSINTKSLYKMVKLAIAGGSSSTFFQNVQKHYIWHFEVLTPV
jgi:hypothetical protein